MAFQLSKPMFTVTDHETFSNDIVMPHLWLLIAAPLGFYLGPYLHATSAPQTIFAAAFVIALGAVTLTHELPQDPQHAQA